MPSPKSRPKPKPESAEAPLSLRFEAIGTHWEIDSFEPVETETAARLEEAVMARIAEFDAAYSRFRPDSLVTAMARQSGRYRLPPDARPMLDLYQHLYEVTQGAMTPLIGQTLSDAGYDAHYSLRPGQLHTPPSWDGALAYQFPYLTLKQPALLDFGAAGKGYLVDIIARLLTHHGVTAYCVDAGGDMIQRGTQPLNVGLEHPDQSGQAIGVAELKNMSLAGSAGNRRAWAGFEHVISPHTLSSPTGLKAVWVTAGTTLLADALTTALYFMTPSALAEHFQFEYCLIRDDSSLEHSRAFPAEFF